MYLYLVLSILIIKFLLDLLIEVLNLKNLKKTLPEEFKDVFDEKKYQKSQEYTRVLTKFGLFKSGVALCLTVLFVYFGGFNSVDIFALGFGYGQIGTGVIFIFFIYLISFFLGLPFSAYSTFVIEKRFDFNRTTPLTFLQDKIKSLVLSSMITGPVVMVVIYFFLIMGEVAWLYCWIFVSIFSLFLAFIAPVIILPLFNKFTPLEDGSLKNIIASYVKEQNFRISGLFSIDGSKRSTKANAYFTGFGNTKRIALYDTLISQMQEQEILAVLAHEVGHCKKGHIKQSFLMSILSTGLMFYLLSLFMNNQALFEDFGMQNISIYASLIFFGFLYTPISMMLDIFQGVLSRKNEYQADEFSKVTTKNSKYLIGALKKLSSSNLSNLTPHPLKVFVYYSHPPVLERIKALRH